MRGLWHDRASHGARVGYKGASARSVKHMRYKKATTCDLHCTYRCLPMVGASRIPPADFSWGFLTLTRILLARQHTQFATDQHTSTCSRHLSVDSFGTQPPKSCDVPVPLSSPPLLDPPLHTSQQEPAYPPASICLRPPTCPGRSARSPR
jgi:hypothetical protein